MAQLPIFQGDFSSDEALLRPARIGPMQTRQPAAEALERGAGQMQDTINQLKQQQLHTQIAGVQASYDKQMADAKVKMLQTPFTTMDDWQNRMTSMVDPTKILAGSGLPAQTQNLMQNELKARMTESFWLPMMDMGVSKMKKSIDDSTSAALGTWLHQASTTDSFSDAARHAADGESLIRQNGVLAGLDQGSIDKQVLEFKQQMGQASIMHMTTTRAGAAAVIQMSQNPNDPYWSTLDEKTQHEAFTSATEQLTMSSKLLKDQLDSEAADAGNKILADIAAGRPYAGELEQARAKYPQLEDLYQRYTGHPYRNTLPSDPGAVGMFSQVMKTGTVDEVTEAMENLKWAQAAGTVNAKDSAALMKMGGDRKVAAKQADEHAFDNLKSNVLDSVFPASSAIDASINRFYPRIDRGNLDAALKAAWDNTKHDPIKTREIIDKWVADQKKAGTTLTPGVVNKFTK